jgi:transcriptional regulator with XRE-family HTH domain
MPTQNRQLIALLRDRDFRDHFTFDQVYELLAVQIRQLREKRQWTQAELGARAGMGQVQVSRVENPDYKGARLTTLGKLANAFDVALMVRFAPFSELANWLGDLSSVSFEPPSFDEELPALRYGAGQTGDFASLMAMTANSNISDFETHKQRPITEGTITADEFESPLLTERRREGAIA